MLVTDLIPLGRINPPDRKNYYRIILKSEFEEFPADITDLFLIFPDHRVRYVTIQDLRIESAKIWVKFLEDDVYPEINEFRRIRVMLDPKDYNNSTMGFDPYGMEVYKDGNLIGKITDYIDNSIQVVYTVELSDGKEFMFPGVEQYVESIDENGIHVKNIDELIDL
jgi:ribosomal 30S subunit maturation factor RimM